MDRRSVVSDLLHWVKSLSESDKEELSKKDQPLKRKLDEDTARV